MISAISLFAISMAMSQQIGDEPQGRSFKKAPAFPETMELVTKAQMSRAEVGVDNMILEPEGTAELYSMMGVGISSIYGGLWESTMSGATDIVWGADNKVYIHNPLGAFTNAYVEGTLSEDGTQVVVELPQTVAAMRNWNGTDYDYYPLNVSVMVKTSTYEEEIEDGGATYAPEWVEGENKVVYDLSVDGTLTQVDPYQEGFEEDPNGQQYLLYPERMLSCYITVPENVWYGTGTDNLINVWYGYTNLNQVFTPLPKDMIEYEIPEDLEWNNNWAIKSEGDYYGFWNELVPGAIKDNRIYFTNMSYLIPDAVLVGEIDGNKVTFKTGQYMGICTSQNRYITFTGVKVTENEDGTYTWELSDEDVVFDYDTDTQTMKMVITDKTNGMIMNSLIGDIYYYCAFNEPTIHLQTAADLAYAPVEPEILAWNDYSEWYDYAYYGATFEFPMFNTNGAIINYDDLYYRVFFNDQVFIFYPDEYGVEEEMEWVPTTFIDTQWRIIGYGDMVMIYFFNEGVNKVGLQSGYFDENGNLYTSEIVSLQVGQDGINSVAAEANSSAEPRWFNLQGIEVANPTVPGIYIDANSGRKIIKK